MFNERDRRCAAVQLLLSTDPSYDNRTIASTLNIQIWIATNNRDVSRVMKTKFPATVMVFGLVSSEGHIMPPLIVEVGLKVNTKVYVWMCWRVWWSPRRRPTSPKRPRLSFRRSYYDFVPFSHCHPPPTWTHWTTSFGHTSRTSPTWLPTTPKPAWSPPPSAEYSPSSRRRLWKRHTPSSGSVSRRWLRLKVATLNRCQLYYIIKLPELIFSIKVLKKAVVLFSLGRQFYRSTLYYATFFFILIMK